MARFICIIHCTIEKCDSNTQDIVNILEWIMVPHSQGTFTIIYLHTIQSNLFNTDAKGTEPIVRFTEALVL